MSFERVLISSEISLENYAQDICAYCSQYKELRQREYISHGSHMRQWANVK